MQLQKASIVNINKQNGELENVKIKTENQKRIIKDFWYDDPFFLFAINFMTFRLQSTCDILLNMAEIDLNEGISDESEMSQQMNNLEYLCDIIFKS